MDHYGIGGKFHLPLPYGQNEGDMWLAPGSPVQNLLDEEGKGMVLVTEMMVSKESGLLEEHFYVTDNPEMIAEAQAGHERYMEAQAARN